MHTNKEQAEEALKEFKEEVEKLKDSNDRLLAQYLLNWCHTEIESLKIQQVVTPQLTSVINASELAMAEKREVTTAFLLRTLSNNHIGVIWDCYIGREHRIVCELKVLFITILAKPEKTLRLTLEQRSGMHINLIMEYADDVHLEKIANDNKMKIEMIEEDISTIRH